MSEKKILAQGIVPASTIGVLYECPGNYTALVSLITVMNWSSGYTVEVRKALNTLTNGTLVFKFILDEGDKHMNDDKINMIAGDKILGVSNMNTTEFIIEGIETTTT